MAPPARGVSAETDGAPEPPPAPRGCSAAAALGGLGWARMDGNSPRGMSRRSPTVQRGARRSEPTPHPKAFRTVGAGPPGARGGGRRHRTQVSAPRERRGKECAAAREQRWDSPGTTSGPRRIRCQAAPGTAPASPSGTASCAAGEEEGPRSAIQRDFTSIRGGLGESRPTASPARRWRCPEANRLQPRAALPSTDGVSGRRGWRAERAANHLPFGKPGCTTASGQGKQRCAGCWG